MALDELHAPRANSTPLPDGIARIYFHHIRKTGGTSLLRSFLGLGGEDPVVVERRIADSFFGRTQSHGLVFAAGHKEVLNRGRYFFAFSHNPAHELRLPDGTFTVTVLRDPLRRVLSYYSYLRAGDGPDAAFPVKEKERQLAADGLAVFLQRVPRHHLLRQLYTFSRTYDVEEAAIAIRRCSAVISNERYEEGLRAVGERLGLPLIPRKDRVTPHSDEPLDEAVLQRIRDLLEPEYELLRRVDDDVSGLDG
jgi:hypothetical protein